MTHPRLSAEEARRLMLEQGYAYVDVRTVEEFVQGHPEGAYNVPVMLRTARGMVENPRFTEVMAATFAKDAKLVVGCRSGSRSKTAAGKLLAAGFTDIVEQRAGFSGLRDAFGKAVEPGWEGAGLPCAREALAGRDYRTLAGE